MKEAISCPNCGGVEKVQLYARPDRHYGIKGLFTYSRCVHCGLEFLDPMPSQDELMSYYPEATYYAYNAEFRNEDSWWKNLARTVLFLNYETRDPVFQNPGRVLDIGCGSGLFLYRMRERGWEVKGVEPSKEGAEAGKRIAGLDIHHGDLLSARFGSETFDYVRLNHSFEHIPNIVEVLSEIRRILKPGGKGFIGVPNIRSLTGRLFGQYWYYLGAPIHTYNFDYKTVPDLLRRQGFRRVSVVYNSNYNGILGSIQIWLNRNNLNTADRGFVTKFMPLKIVAGLLAKLSDAIRLGDCIEVIFEKA